MALPRAHRLRSGSIISLVCKKGVSVKTPFFRMVFLPARNNRTQMVVVVSKKYDKRAVARNQIRRKILGSMSLKFFLELKKNIVVFPYDSARNASHADLLGAACQGFKKILSKISHKKVVLKIRRK